MKKNPTNNSGGPGRLLSQLAAEKKKTVAALCLIALMVFMWARMLSGKTPQSADAALMAQVASFNTSASNRELKVSFVDLPKVKGRNDILTRDFFAANDWANFIRGRLIGVGEVGVLKDGNEELAGRIAKRLRVEAIGLGQNPQAFINDRLTSVGDKLLVKDGAGAYECEVVAIEENAVFIRCGEVEIQLKLMHENEGVN